MGLPLLREGVPIGSMTLYRTEVRPFSAREVALLKTFADQAVIAIENTRLFNETREALERQTATSEVLRVIGGSPTDAQPVFDVIGPNALRVCGAEACGVILVEDGALHFAAATALRPEWVEAARAVFPQPVDAPLLSARVVRERRTVHVTDVQSHPEASPQARALARTMGFQTVLMVPMLRAGDAIGVIAVTRREAALFSPRQVELLQTFADQAVIAIENVRLFRELEARNQELTRSLDRQTATADILRVISQAQMDAQPVFEAIAVSAQRLFGAWSASVWIRTATPSSTWPGGRRRRARRTWWRAFPGRRAHWARTGRPTGPCGIGSCCTSPTPRPMRPLRLTFGNGRARTRSAPWCRFRWCAQARASGSSR